MRKVEEIGRSPSSVQLLVALALLIVRAVAIPLLVFSL